MPTSGWWSIVALLVGLPTWYLAGYRLGLLIAKRYPDMPVPNLLGEPKDYSEEERPGFWTIIFVLVLPLLLIFFNTVFSTLEADGVVGEDSIAFQVSRLIGTTSMALLITVLLAMVLLYVVPRRRRGEPIGGLLENLVDDALAPVCSIILITGAGGAFGKVLTETGIGQTLADGLDAWGLPVMLAGFLIAIVFRVAQGSATVAATTAGSIMAPAVTSMNLGAIALAAVVVGIMRRLDHVLARERLRLLVDRPLLRVRHGDHIEDLDGHRHRHRLHGLRAGLGGLRGRQLRGSRLRHSRCRARCHG